MEAEKCDYFNQRCIGNRQIEYFCFEVILRYFTITKDSIQHLLYNAEGVTGLEEPEATDVCTVASPYLPCAPVVVHTWLTILGGVDCIPGFKQNQDYVISNNIKTNIQQILL